MTDARSPLDTVLDLVIYAPLGAALTVGEEMPRLAAKGRERLSGQLATARVVGQFAVAQGRQEAAKVLGRTDLAGIFAARGRKQTAPSADDAAAGAAGEPASPSSAPSGAPAPSASVAEEGGPPGEPLVDPLVGGPAGVTTPSAPATGPSEGSPALGIPGYDSLSASQVVQRLAGLSSAELEAVAAYEAAHRGRRTILARVGQLQQR